MADNGQVKYWLALLRAPGVGSRTCIRLLEHFSHPAELFSAPRAELQACGLKGESLSWLCSPDWSAVEPDLRWLERPRNHLITFNAPDYPALLREITDPPPVLFVHGDPQRLQTPQLAMVGSRNPSVPGRQTAREFARFLASAGLTITSGLAIGIDAAAHEGALEAAGPGATIAVTGTGLDRVYPGRHRELAHRIADEGALVSEFPSGTAPRPANFPRRNRIISGLSLGTLVVEAAQRSGSLITARQALEQGREVLAIPGSIHNPLSRGCNDLIRQGAKLVETGRDVLEELGHLLGGGRDYADSPEDAADVRTEEMDPDYRRLLDSMGFDPVAVDTLIERNGLTPDVVSSMLLLLELDGYVSSAPGGRYCRTGKN